MLHPVQDPPGKPGPSLPGCSLGEYPRQHYPPQSQVPYGMQPPRQHDSRLVITRKLRPPHTPRPGGRRFPPPRFRSASPPPASPPTPRRKEAPRPGLRHHVRASHHASGPPRIPQRRSKNGASGASFVSSTSEARAATSGRYGVKCCPRHSRRFLHSLSVVACSLVIPAGSLDPAPCGGKEHLSVLRSQNPVFTGFAKPRHRSGGAATIPRVPGEVGWASMVQAVICGRRCSWLQSAVSIQPQPSPALGRSRPVNRYRFHRPARPHPRSTEPSG